MVNNIEVTKPNVHVELQRIKLDNSHLRLKKMLMKQNSLSEVQSYYVNDPILIAIH